MFFRKQIASERALFQRNYIGKLDSNDNRKIDCNLVLRLKLLNYVFNISVVFTRFDVVENLKASHLRNSISFEQLEHYPKLRVETYF